MKTAFDRLTVKDKALVKATWNNPDWYGLMPMCFPAKAGVSQTITVSGFFMHEEEAGKLS